MADSVKTVVDTEKIRKAALSGIPLSITTYTLSHEMEIYITDVLESFLKAIGHEHIKEYLAYCIQELAVNAKKANTKRVYFKEKNLDITNPNDYRLGMKSFKEDTLSDIIHYLKKQKEEGLYVKIVLQVEGETITIEIRNNSEMVSDEYVRIHDKLARSKKISVMGDSLSQILDDSEGAGLGLVIIMQMLRKIGLTEENYEVMVEDGETITRLTIPFDTKTKEGIDELSDEVIKAVDDLPQFPENIQELQRLLGDPEAKLSEVARRVSTDAALTGDLLKLVNSAAFAMGKKCNNITEAVKLVGFKGLKDLLYSYGTQQILGTSTESQKKLWKHCYKTAFFAYNLAKNFGKNSNLLNDIYTCGILHDMGKIIFAKTHKGVSEKITAFCKKRNVTPALMESLFAGNNHGEIGARIAERWNFPDILVWSIRYHHNPSIAPGAIRTLVSMVYIADAMCNYIDGTIDYYQLDKGVLSTCSIENEATFIAILKQLDESFNSSI